MNDFFRQIDLIQQRISALGSANPPPYIHCSKINSFLLQIKNVASNLKSYKFEQSKKAFASMRTNLPNLFSALDHFQQLHSQCCSDVCGQIALTTSMRAVKGEINSIRKSCIKCLESIGFQPATQYLGLSDEELDLQDQVDIKRISVLLNQLQMRPDLSNRPDVSRHLQNRLNSLEDLGITISNDEREIVTIPDIPQSLNIVVKLSDIIMGEEIGSGQAGRVIHGILKPTNCEVAVKILHNRVLSSSDMEMFKREIFTMAVLRHPSLVRFYGYTSEPPFCILTEYMPNGSLYDFLHDHPDQLSPTERTLIALDIARGLEYLHGRGIIHRDLKSLNILLDQRKRAKICDFGLIRMKSSDPMTGLVGTACWMAPEVLISSPCYDEKVDVYSFGILLWELLTGERPYFDIDYGQLTFEIVEKNRRPIIPENVPKNLKELIEKCWERDPKLRPSFHQIISDLSDKSYQFPGSELVVLIQEVSPETNIINNRNKYKKYLSINSGLMFNNNMNNQNKIIGKNYYLNNFPRIISKINEIIEIGHVEHYNIVLEQLRISALNPNIDFEKFLPILIKIINNLMDNKFKIPLIKTFFNILIETNAIKFLDIDFIPNLIDNNKENEEIIKNVCIQMSINLKNEFFSEKLINSLMKFKFYPNQSIRIGILNLILNFVVIKEEFFIKNINFIINILEFTNKKIPIKIYMKLLKILKKLFEKIETYPNDLNKILVKLNLTISNKLKHLFVNSIEPLTKFNEFKEFVINIITNENIKYYMNIFNYYKDDIEIIKNICKYSSTNEYVLDFIITLNDNIIIEILPINNENYQKLSKIYSKLFKYPNKILSFQEFYNSIPSFFSNTEQLNELINLLHSNEVNYEMLNISKVPNFICENIKNQKNLIETLRLLYTLILKFDFIQFHEIVEILFSLLNNETNKITKLSFLCLVSLLNYTNVNYNYNFDVLLCCAAKIINVFADSNLVQKSCANLFCKYLDNVSDLDNLIKIFCDNYNENISTENMKFVMKCLANECIKRNVDNQQLNKMLECVQ